MSLMAIILWAGSAAMAVRTAGCLCTTRLSITREIPAREIEEVDRLLQHPTADARGIVAPARRAEAVGFAREFDEHVLRLADHVGVDPTFDLAPLRGEPEFVADREFSAALARQPDDRAAIVNGECHRFFEEQIAAGIERGPVRSSAMPSWNARCAMPACSMLKP